MLDHINFFDFDNKHFMKVKSLVADVACSPAILSTDFMKEYIEKNSIKGMSAAWLLCTRRYLLSNNDNRAEATHRFLGLYHHPPSKPFDAFYYNYVEGIISGEETMIFYETKTEYVDLFKSPRRIVSGKTATSHYKKEVHKRNSNVNVYYIVAVFCDHELLFICSFTGYDAEEVMSKQLKSEKNGVTANMDFGVFCVFPSFEFIYISPDIEKYRGRLNCHIKSKIEPFLEKEIFGLLGENYKRIRVELYPDEVLEEKVYKKYHNMVFKK